MDYKRYSLYPPSAMGDIAFLLFIFFSLIGTIYVNKQAKANLPIIKGAEKYREEKANTIKISIPENNKYIINGKKITKQNLVEYLDRIISARSKKRKILIDFYVKKNVLFINVKRVLDTLKKYKNIKVRFIVLKKED